MFIGHYGVAFGAKKSDNKPSLGTYFMACQFMDLLWPLFLLLGIERVEIVPSTNPFLSLNFVSYPYSHSLFASIIWSFVFGTVYFLKKKDSRSSIILGLVVFSHWILDFIVHVPDLQIFPWMSARVGLGLWNSVLFSVIVEGLIFGIGFFLYLNSTKSKNKSGTIVTWSLVIFLIIIYLLNLTSPPPPSVNAIAYAGFAQWLIVFWAYWADKNREAKTQPLANPIVSK